MQVIGVDVLGVELRRQCLRHGGLARTGDAHHGDLKRRVIGTHQSWTVPSRSRL